VTVQQPTPQPTCLPHEQPLLCPPGASSTGQCRTDAINARKKLEREIIKNLATSPNTSDEKFNPQPPQATPHHTSQPAAHPTPSIPVSLPPSLTTLPTTTTPKNLTCTAETMGKLNPTCPPLQSTQQLTCLPSQAPMYANGTTCQNPTPLSSWAQPVSPHDVHPQTAGVQPNATSSTNAASDGNTSSKIGLPLLATAAIGYGIYKCCNTQKEKIIQETPEEQAARGQQNAEVIARLRPNGKGQQQEINYEQKQARPALQRKTPDQVALEKALEETFKQYNENRKAEEERRLAQDREVAARKAEEERLMQLARDREAAARKVEEERLEKEHLEQERKEQEEREYLVEKDQEEHKKRLQQWEEVDKLSQAIEAEQRQQRERFHREQYEKKQAEEKARQEQQLQAHQEREAQEREARAEKRRQEREKQEEKDRNAHEARERTEQIARLRKEIRRARDPKRIQDLKEQLYKLYPPEHRENDFAPENNGCTLS
jgi:hypothetical protein